MRDVAREAGVSRATVSLALRHHPGIPERTRVRVAHAADKLGYRPDPLISALMARLHGKRTTSETPTLAVLDCSTARPASQNAFDQFLSGVIERAGALGYRIESFPCHASGMTEERLERVLRARNIFGILLPPLVTGNQSVRLEWSRYAVAGFASRQGDLAVDRVGADHFANATLALERLTERGHRRIGFAMPSAISLWVQNKWLAAYLVHQSEIPSRRRIPPWLPDGLEREAFQAWYREHRPDAVLFLRDIDAFAARIGLRIPEDLSLASLNTPSGSEIGGIVENGNAIGAAAVDLLISRIHRNERGLPVHPQSVLIRGTWHSGRTVADRSSNL